MFRAYDKNGKLKKRNDPGIDCQKAIENGEKIRVEQHHESNTNINKIVKKHGADLIAKVSELSQFKYDDVTGNDFQETMNAMIRARDTFSQVPSAIRKQFGNDAAAFMDFVHDPANADKLVEMGLANSPEPPPEPVKVEITNPTPPAETPPE